MNDVAGSINSYQTQIPSELVFPCLALESKKVQLAHFHVLLLDTIAFNLNLSDISV